MRLTNAGPSLEHVMATLERRRQSRGIIVDQMLRIRDAYNGDIVIPLPELDTQEQAAVPNLILNGLDQSSQRIASVLPGIHFPPLRPGIKISEQRARTRRLATLSWWEQNKLDLKMARRARWFVGYGAAPAVIRPDMKRGIPRWEIRDPLSAYPCPTTDPDDITPPDAIFTFQRSWAWLRDRYAEEVSKLCTGYRYFHEVPGHIPFDIVEYMDGDVFVLGAMGRQEGDIFNYQDHSALLGTRGEPYVELERVPTKIGLCPAVFPGRITLDRPHGQFDGTIGMYHMQARLMALEAIAAERGIFPDTYLVSRQGETATFIDGPHDGRTGMVNIVKGGDIKDATVNPGFAALQQVDRLERAQRITGGVPAEFGGESPTNVRTGRRGDAVLSAIVDFPVQEAQKVFGYALQEENRRAVATAREFFRDMPKQFYVTFGKSPGYVDYKPREDFETDANVVTYPQAGADVNGQTIMAGQLVGLGMLSKRSGMQMHPMVADPEKEYGLVVGEQLEAALLASLQQQAQAGMIPPADIARITELVNRNQMELVDAVATVQREAQERQAAAGEPGTPAGPVEPGSPEAQPGLAQAGVGQEQPTVGPPGEGSLNLSSLLNSLRTPQRRVPSERPVA